MLQGELFQCLWEDRPRGTSPPLLSAGTLTPSVQTPTSVSCSVGAAP